MEHPRSHPVVTCLLVEIPSRQELPTRVKLESSRFNSTMEDEEEGGEGEREHTEPRYVTAEQDLDNEYTQAQLEEETRYLRIQQEQGLRYMEPGRVGGEGVEMEEEEEEEEEEGAEEEGAVGHQMERLPVMNGQVMMAGHNHVRHLDQEQPQDLRQE